MPTRWPPPSAARDAVRHLDARQQRDRRDPARRRPGRGSGRATGASPSTPTRCRRSAGSRSNFHALGVATLAASATSSTGRWASGCSWCERGVRARPAPLRRRSTAGSAPGHAWPYRWSSAWPRALEKWQARGRDADRPLAAAPRPARIRPDRRARPRSRRPQRPAWRRRLALPQTLNVGFPGLDGDALLMQLDLAGVAASLGSACASGSTRLSPTLLAMHVPDDRIRSSVRFSLGRRRRPRRRSTRPCGGSSRLSGGHEREIALPTQSRGGNQGE